VIVNLTFRDSSFSWEIHMYITEADHIVHSLLYGLYFNVFMDINAKLIWIRSVLMS